MSVTFVVKFTSTATTIEWKIEGKRRKREDGESRVNRCG